MSKNAHIKLARAWVTLELVSPLIRESLLDEATFQKECGLKLGVILTVGDSGVSFKRSELYASIRKVFSDASELNVCDTDGRPWSIRTETEQGKQSVVVLFSDKERMVLPDFTVLSPNPSLRLHSFDKTAFDLNLPADSLNKWRHILMERSLEDSEVSTLHNDFCETPVYVARAISDEIKIGQSNISSLVPNSRRYFERLAGVYDGSASIRDYATGTIRKFFKKLSEWQPYEGFLSSLLLSSHSAITAEINIGCLKKEDLVRAFAFLEKHGDRVSQIGAIEVGLSILPEASEIEPMILNMVKQIRDDPADDPINEFSLLYALFVLVDGELSKIRLMSTEPPFFRRLASLSQAALIHRQLMGSNVDEKFCERLLRKSGEQFHMQSLADMRLEPHWAPHLASSHQIKGEFLNRIMIAASNNRANIKNKELRELIFGVKPDSLRMLSESHYSYLRGPLEGTEGQFRRIPDDLARAIEGQLNADDIKLASFITLVNSALFFQADSKHAELATKALKLCKHQFANVGDSSELLGILDGLAIVAAASRNFMLADELRIFMRRCRYGVQYHFKIEDEVRICLVASASHKNMDEWRKYVGDWLTELAFEKLEGDAGSILHSHIRCLCHSVPDLWFTCGEADAALAALNNC